MEFDCLSQILISTTESKVSLDDLRDNIIGNLFIGSALGMIRRSYAKFN